MPLEEVMPRDGGVRASSSHPSFLPLEASEVALPSSAPTAYGLLGMSGGRKQVFVEREERILGTMAADRQDVARSPRNGSSPAKEDRADSSEGLEAADDLRAVTATLHLPGFVGSSRLRTRFSTLKSREEAASTRVQERKVLARTESSRGAKSPACDPKDKSWPRASRSSSSSASSFVANAGIVASATTGASLQSRDAVSDLVAEGAGSLGSAGQGQVLTANGRVARTREDGNVVAVPGNAVGNVNAGLGNVNEPIPKSDEVPSPKQAFVSATTSPRTSPPTTTSSSSWNTSTEQESLYIVDSAEGNAYYKGQFLGKGGFARVYLMTDLASGKQYACKIIPKNRMQKIHMQKIAREIVIHKELNHPNVVQMHHYFEDNLNAYILLEACTRKSLMHVLKYRGKVTEPEARYYMKQMVTGVAYIHSRKVIHRDLKPGNMFLSENMVVKIGDFGLATRPYDHPRRVTICGTPNYIAPEVLYKQACSYEADVWALGCILYVLLVGQPPFETATLKETYARICDNRYREVDDTVASRNGQDLVRRLLEPNPKLRPSLEKVKRHPYLTKEYVPSSLPHFCCYQPPPATLRRLSTVSSTPTPPPSPPSPPLPLLKSSSSPEPESSSRLGQVSKNERSETQKSAFERARSKASQKESKVKWLAKKLPKLPRFKQRLSSALCPNKKKVRSGVEPRLGSGGVAESVQMHRALEDCLTCIRCTRFSANPKTVEEVAPLFITKWIDYSNKYGLGFQLPDRSVGVLFNDSTKMSYTHDRSCVEYVTSTDEDLVRYEKESDVPLFLKEKLYLLQFFAEYMDEHLTEGGEVRGWINGAVTAGKRRTRRNGAFVPRMRRWLRTDKAIVMELNVPFLQVNFFVDHTKMVVSKPTGSGAYLVTYINPERRTSSYWLNDIRDYGCTADLHERLHYVCKVAREFSELDQNAPLH
ncbi:serine/threonine-protein kinase plk-2-like [Orussus abietinus]|uniref:serine/threonine-protein kinase plk-2-like n=1 Tax=Orussus abietinus TaxID=222816 RepID=UPI000626454D|nr:serine/threonine-protein kinase plk-2-like [Orussus abietinus]